MSNPKQFDERRAKHLERYGEHARRLQTWIGAYCAGLASLLIYQFRTAVADVTARISANTPDSELAADIVSVALAKMRGELNIALVLIACAFLVQVVLLLFQKFCQWVCVNFEVGTSWRRTAKPLERVTRFAILFDLTSIALLIVATLHGLSAIGLM